jgi:uncharacterized protein Veg
MKIKSKVSELLGETVTFKDSLGKIRTAKVVGLVEYAGETLYPDKYFILNYIDDVKEEKDIDNLRTLFNTEIYRRLYLNVSIEECNGWKSFSFLYRAINEFKNENNRQKRAH